jgi:hypothetical protein
LRDLDKRVKSYEQSKISRHGLIHAIPKYFSIGGSTWAWGHMAAWA